MKMRKSVGFVNGRNSMLLAAAVVGASAALASAGDTSTKRAPLTPTASESAAQSTGTASTVAAGSAGRAGGDATSVVWDNGGLTGMWSTAANWNPDVAPATTNDDPTFDGTLAGNYSTANDLAATSLGNLTVSRALASETTTVTGGYSGLGVRVINGGLTLSGPSTSTIGTVTSTVIDLQIGTLATSNSSLTVSGQAVVNYTDILAGFNAAGQANITVTGAGTKLQRINSTFDSFFGGNAGNSNILVDAGASVEANLVRAGTTGTFKVTNGSTVIANNVGTTIAGIALFGNFDNGGVTAEVSGASTFTVNSVPTPANANTAGQFRVGFGNKSNSTATISQGSTVTSAVFAVSAGNPSAGRAANPSATPPVTALNGTAPANIVPSTVTTTVTGANTKVIASTYVSIGSLANFSNVYSNGTATLNIENGAQVFGGIVRLGAPNPATFTTTNFADASPVATTVNLGISNNIINVTGAGSLLRAGTTGLVNGSLQPAFGTRTNSIVSVGGGGLIEAGSLTDGTYTTLIPSNTGVFNVNSGGTLSVTGRIDVGNGGGATGMGSAVTYNINAGGILNNAEAIVVSDGLGGSATFNVNGGTLNTLYYQTGGYGGGTAGTGASLLSVTNGGTVNISEGLGMEVRGSQPDKIDPNHGVITVSGTNSKLTITGVPAVGTTAAITADAGVGEALNAVATINVLNGGVFTMEQNTVGQQGRMFLGDADYASGILNVDGAGSKFFSGIRLIVSEGGIPTGETIPTPLSGTSGIVNVKNGGLFDVNGTVRLATYSKAADGDDLTAIVNVGGGANAATDAATVFNAHGGAILVGGREVASVATVGAAAQFNLINGTVRSGDALVYTGSTINITKGVFSSRLDASGATGFISARGGKVIVNPSSAARAAVLVGDHFETSLGGSIDIAKGGGVSIKATAADTDLADIKALIISNGIKSSAVTSPTGNVGIGYAPKGLRTSFDGYTFAAGEDAIVFGYTLKGDSDVSGTVDFDDLVSLAQNYLQAGTKEWYQGNFDYASGDTDVDFDDLVSLAQNYLSTASLDGVGSSQFQSDWALAQSLVPEPTTLGLLASAGIFAARRRRR